MDLGLEVIMRFIKMRIHAIVVIIAALATVWTPLNNLWQEANKPILVYQIAPMAPPLSPAFARAVLIRNVGSKTATDVQISVDTCAPIIYAKQVGGQPIDLHCKGQTISAGPLMLQHNEELTIFYSSKNKPSDPTVIAKCSEVECISTEAYLDRYRSINHRAGLIVLIGFIPAFLFWVRAMKADLRRKDIEKVLVVLQRDYDSEHHEIKNKNKSLVRRIDLFEELREYIQIQLLAVVSLFDSKTPEVTKYMCSDIYNDGLSLCETLLKHDNNKLQVAGWVLQNDSGTLKPRACLNIPQAYADQFTRTTREGLEGKTLLSNRVESCDDVSLEQVDYLSHGCCKFEVRSMVAVPVAFYGNRNHGSMCLYLDQPISFDKDLDYASLFSIVGQIVGMAALLDPDWDINQ
jgi:hypothetical protein